MQARFTISLFSRHPDLLQLLSALLARQEDVEVVSATVDPLEFAEQVRLCKPSVALLDDFHVPDLADLCRDVVDAFDKTSLVILRSPLVGRLPALPHDLRCLELQKPVRVPNLVRRLEDFATNSMTHHDSATIAC
jgi:DNA-binding NarL/FixJ family response regulator